MFQSLYGQGQGASDPISEIFNLFGDGDEDGDGDVHRFSSSATCVFIHEPVAQHNEFKITLKKRVSRGGGAENCSLSTTTSHKAL